MNQPLLSEGSPTKRQAEPSRGVGRAGGGGVKQYADVCHVCNKKVRFDTDGDGVLVQLDYETWRRHPHRIPTRVAGAEL